jgi:hypothetical protein
VGSQPLDEVVDAVADVGVGVELLEVLLEELDGKEEAREAREEHGPVQQLDGEEIEGGLGGHRVTDAVEVLDGDGAPGLAVFGYLEELVGLVLAHLLEPGEHGLDLGLGQLGHAVEGGVARGVVRARG